ncbi:cation-translocating P-type ATPase [Specibacter cremeus]|uniref:cation-translocating P-type ATPase n=1 Tax=Specibacter cremeus TaxID=1629051 RepID=UPI001F0B9980|nr:cation-translocating P-type ATPase [Specibacter cremeus]
MQRDLTRNKPKGTVLAERRDTQRRAVLAQAREGLGPVDAALLAATGLTAAQVHERRKAELTNEVRHESSRSVWAIMRANIFTLFNGVLGAALVLVLLVGDPRDALFGFIVVANAAIGVVQEYRAKRTLDRLAVLHAPRAVVVRDGAETPVAVADVLYDDVLVLRTGDQVPADAVVLHSDSLELDESLLTGESDPVDKATGDEVLSGSAVVAGSGRARVHRVGPDSYASALTAEARRFSLVNSEIRNSINRIIIYITWALVPIILLVVNGQMRAHGGWRASLADGQWRAAVISAVASIVAMIPEGLVLLTSISFGVAAVTLARRQVLVQELPAVEGLARVDMLCLDKTGTLTEGRMELAGTAMLADVPVDGWAEVLGWLASHPNANATAAALLPGYPDRPAADPADSVPFSSARKFSAVRFDDAAGSLAGEWVFGAPEVVLDGRVHDATHGAALARAASAAEGGLRAVVLAHTPPGGPVAPVALLTFREKVRADAAATLQYFRDQGVALKIISGDNPVTVSAVASGLGVTGAGFDARELPEDPDALGEVLDAHTVFGRVTPEQKKAMVLALQRRGHVVAMTGDGVNDALALKHADIGIAMGSGAAATKAVSRLVLLDGQFSRLPGVVAEGRRVIANVERVANLFLTKTAYAVIISIAIGLLAWRYPFLPRQLSIISSLTIGVPAFFLALMPNRRRYHPGFLRRTLGFAIPAGTILSACIMAVYGIGRWLGATEVEAATATTMTVLLVALWVLGALARPFDAWRVLLVAAMAGALVLIMLVPFARDFFALALPSGLMFAVTMGVVAAGCAAIEALYRWLKRRGAISGRE